MAPIPVDVTYAEEYARPKKVVVVGLGMVGVAFIDKLFKYDDEESGGRSYTVTVIGEEPYLAYNRVGLTQYLKHHSVPDLYLNPLEWYSSHGPGRLEYHTNDLVDHIEVEAHRVTTRKGHSFDYDLCVLSLGSHAALPPYVSPSQAKSTNGVFVYRNVEDLDRMMEYAIQHGISNVCVVGGGLLGLEAAGAVKELQSIKKVTLVERNEWVLSRQLDSEGGTMVLNHTRTLGIDVLVKAHIQEINTIKSDEYETVTGITLTTGEYHSCEMIVFAIGIKARDELARECGINVHNRGGIIVDNELTTSARDVFAIGECASWQGETYGLIAPGIEMADILAFNLTLGPQHQMRAMKTPDMSTRLKLLGVDVASFGDYFADRKPPTEAKPTGRRRRAAASSQGVKALRYHDPFASVYKKYLFSADGKYIVGGMMVGDITGYEKLVSMVKKQKPIEVPPGQLILGIPRKEGEEETDDLDDDAQVCSCHNVSKKAIMKCVAEGCSSFNELKSKTKIATGCGGCAPLATTIFNAQMKKAGHTVNNFLCLHFKKSRQDVFTIAKVKKLKTFMEVMKEAGEKPDAIGCEVCKPAVGSILASLHNEFVMSEAHLQNQDTNDKYLANMQRNGTFSVVPRIPAGEITPAKLKAIGEVGEKYGLYTKVTGAQRIDLFGAAKHDLPQIWEELGQAGFESGHAYGKALRTVKSCVGSTWCRYGIGDSVGFAVELEERYKGIRAPHKIKGGVSGCVRECAEAQSKDFGLIATAKGWNVYVGGNGGAKPRHAELLATDVPKKKAICLVDRFLMLYIQSADRLQRTARWVESLSEGGTNGLAYLRKVIIDDSLGICADLDRAMDELVGTYFDEWAIVVKDPQKRALFKQFINTDDAHNDAQTITERGQRRPVDPPEEGTAPMPISSVTLRGQGTWKWRKIARLEDLRPGSSGSSSAVVKYSDVQIALFRLADEKLYATQHACPHRRAFVMAEGLIGDTTDGTPYVSCPLHKRNFKLTTGECISDGAYKIMTFSIKEIDGDIYLELPEPSVLDQHLGTSHWLITPLQAQSVSASSEEQTPDDDVVGGIEIVRPTLEELNGVGAPLEGAGCAGACGSQKLEW